jgi:predicted ribosomally synthesized peptide with SipW-like signal peptide
MVSAAHSYVYAMKSRAKSAIGHRASAGGIVVALVSLLAAGGAVAAFSSSARNDNNRFTAGSVALDDNDAGTAMFSLSGMRPGDTDSACIKVMYTGSLGSTVRLYGAVTGTGLQQYASLTVTRGTYTGAEPSFDSCTNFSADTTSYISGQQAGVIYAGTLAGFPTTWSSGVVDPYSTAPESWITGEAHVYRLQVTLGDNATAAGKNATQTFTWDAQNQ